MSHRIIFTPLENSFIKIILYYFHFIKSIIILNLYVQVHLNSLKDVLYKRIFQINKLN